MDKRPPSARKGPAAAVAGLLCALAMPAASIAAPKVLPERLLASGGEMTSPVLGVSPLDEAMVIAGDYASDPFIRLFSAVRRADGSVAPIQELARSSGLQSPQALAFNSAGDSLFSWCSNYECNLARHSVRKAGGLSSAPISWDKTDCVGDTQSVAYTAAGAPTVACRGVSGSAPNNNRIVALSAATIDGLFSTRQVLLDGSPDTGLRPAVDIGPDGTRAVAWGEKRSSDLNVKVAIAAPGSSFGTPQTLLTVSSSSASLGGIDVAVLADGGSAVTVRYRLTSGSPPSANMFVRTASAGTFSASLSSISAGAPQVERDGIGALIAWGDRSRDNDDAPVDLKVASVGNPTTPLVNVQTLDSNIYDLIIGRLTVSASGAAAITRMSPNGLGSYVIAGWVRPTGATAFSGPTPFVTERSISTDFSAAMDRHGSLLAAWLKDGGLMLGGLDAAGPELSLLTIPGRLRAGAAGSFSVKAIDPAGVRRVAWTFGDRGSAVGAAARHAFRKPGRYNVEVTATDAAGQQSKASRTVSVSR